MVLAEIITIGDELLIGQVIDTNSAWMAQQLNQIGIKIKQITSVSDDEQHIINALNEAKQRADVILLTGGLGPTKDDITKYTLCKYFKSNLRFDEKVFLEIEKMFHTRGRPVSDTNRKQAEVPEKCTVIYNSKGTAPGMWFETSTPTPLQIERREKQIFVSMPGVPYEMKAMMEHDVLPLLKNYFETPVIIHKTILTHGIGESFLSDMIAGWEDKLPANIKLAYLPSNGLLRLRLSATGENEIELTELLEKEIGELHQLADEFIFGYENDALEKIVGQLLTSKKKTLSTAESCTGGYIAHRITSVPGSSNYYSGSLVAYSYEIKEKFLDIPVDLLNKFGAVSEEVVTLMAKNLNKKFETDYSIACSGIVGPSGGTEQKPVGTVWLAIATPSGVFTKKLLLGNVREHVIVQTSHYALNYLRKILTGMISV